MGSILGLKGHYELAEQYLTEAIRLNPKFPEAYCERGTARAILASANHDPTKRRRAIQDYDAAITLFPGFGKAHQFRKETLRKAA